MEDVEEQTKIRKRYLEALENEHFYILPGQVYVRGFIRSYARYLELDSEALVASFEASVASNDPAGTEVEEPKEAKPAARVPFRRWAGVLAVMALAAMLVFGTSLFRGDNDPAVPDQQLAGQNEQQEPGGGELDSQHDQNGGIDNREPEQPPARSGLNLSLDVRERDCWMQVVVDGQNVFTGNVRPGNSKDFQGERNIHLWLGDAGAVQVKLNGENLGYLGEYGQVVREEFSTADLEQGGRSS